MNSYDLIGDTHGQAAKLEALLKRLGYREINGAYRHPEGRIAGFVGDFIDRGPEQERVLRIVRAMLDAGTSVAILGNHEHGAIGFLTSDEARPGEFLRRHTPNNVHSHASFLEQMGGFGSEKHKFWVDWFRTLPVSLDLGEFRMVHAWWHQEHVDYLKEAMPSGCMDSDEFLQLAFNKQRAAYRALEGLAKGLEIDLPEGVSFTDAGGIVRTQSRVRWWDEAAQTYGQALMLPGKELDPGLQGAIPAGLPLGLTGDTPVFIGHYWLDGACLPLSHNVVCLDYSAAKNGPLVAYRWDGDPTLSAANFVRSDGVEPEPAQSAMPRKARP